MVVGCDRGGNIGCAVDGKCRLCAVSVECKYSVALCELNSRRGIVADYLDAAAVACAVCRENAACVNLDLCGDGELGGVSVYLDIAALHDFNLAACESALYIELALYCESAVYCKSYTLGHIPCGVGVDDCVFIDCLVLCYIDSGVGGTCRAAACGGRLGLGFDCCAARNRAAVVCCACYALFNLEVCAGCVDGCVVAADHSVFNCTLARNLYILTARDKCIDCGGLVHIERSTVCSLSYIGVFNCGAARKRHRAVCRDDLEVCNLCAVEVYIFRCYNQSVGVALDCYAVGYYKSKTRFVHIENSAGDIGVVSYCVVKKLHDAGAVDGCKGSYCAVACAGDIALVDKSVDIALCPAGNGGRIGVCCVHAVLLVNADCAGEHYESLLSCDFSVGGETLICALEDACCNAFGYRVGVPGICIDIGVAGDVGFSLEVQKICEKLSHLCAACDGVGIEVAVFVALYYAVGEPALNGVFTPVSVYIGELRRERRKCGRA